MTREFYASLRRIILRDIADIRGTMRGCRAGAAIANYRRMLSARQRDLIRLRSLRAGTAETP